MERPREKPSTKKLMAIKMGATRKTNTTSKPIAAPSAGLTRRRAAMRGAVLGKRKRVLAILG